MAKLLTLSDIRARYRLPSDEDVLAALTAGDTLPALLYAVPEIHRLEQEKIFARSWQYACHDSQLARPGAVVLAKSGDIPIMIVCADDGELRGFVNVCRHRLHPVAMANGHARLLRCSYHGWTYELDGRLKHAPRQAREPGFDCSAISLKPVSVERWDQFVFVNADADATALAKITAEIRPRTDELNADLKEYEYRVRKTYDAGPDAYRTISWPDTLWHESPIKWIPGGMDPATLKGFRFAFLWPSSFFAVDDFIGFVGSVTPTGPERCSAFADMYVRPGADEETVDGWLKMWDQVLREDAVATNRQQVGYGSGQIPAGRLMLNSEHNLQAFMRRTYQAMTT